MFRASYYLSSGSTFLYIFWIFVSTTYSHVSLTFPPARKYNLDFLDDVRTPEPCGMPKGKQRTLLRMGDLINVTWHLAYPHRGGHRLELLGPDEKFLMNLVTRTSSEPNKEYVKGDATVQWERITLPQSPCYGCTIRLKRQASEWSRGYHFKSCADVDIVPTEKYNENCLGRGELKGVVCDCHRGYWGPRCQYEDECWSSNDCSGHGECIDLGGTALPRKQCFCRNGYHGYKCQIKNKANLPTYENLDITAYKKKDMNERYKLYYKKLKEEGEMEFILVVNGTSYGAIGWRPVDTKKSCKEFPSISESSPDALAVANPEPSLLRVRIRETTMYPPNSLLPSTDMKQGKKDQKSILKSVANISSKAKFKGSEHNGHKSSSIEEPCQEAPDGRSSDRKKETGSNAVDSEISGNDKSEVKPKSTHSGPKNNSTPQPRPKEEASAEPKPEETASSEPKPEQEPSAKPKPEEGASFEPKPEEEASSEPKPEEGASAEPKPEQEPSAEPKPEEAASAEPKPEEEASAESKPEQEPSAEPKPEEAASSEPKPEQEPSAEPKPEEAASAEPKPEEEASAEPKPEEIASAESKPEEAASAEPKPEEEASAEPKPEQEPSAEPKPEQEPSAEPKPEQEPSAEPKPEEGASSEPKPEQEPSAEPKPEEAASAEPKPEEEASSERKPEQEPSAEPKPEEAASSEPKPEQKPSAEPKPEEAASSEPKPEQEPSAESKPEEEASAEPKPEEEASAEPYKSTLDELQPEERLNNSPKYQSGQNIEIFSNVSIQNMVDEHDEFKPPIPRVKEETLVTPFLIPKSRSDNSAEDPEPINKVDSIELTSTTFKLPKVDKRDGSEALPVSISSPTSFKLPPAVNLAKSDLKASSSETSSKARAPKSKYTPKLDFHAMDCTDIVIGAAKGQLSRIRDYYTRDRSTPKPDEFWGGMNDLTSATGWEMKGQTVIIFRRKIVSLDITDYSISGPMHVIWARGQQIGEYIHKPLSGLETEPSSNKNFYAQDEIKYHGQKSQRGVSFIDFSNE